MNFKIKKRSQASIVISLLIILSLRGFYLFQLPISAPIIMYITWIISVVMYFLYARNRRVVRDYGAFLQPYFTYVLVAQFIICVYSMFIYGETILDMFICAGGYLMFLITYVVIRIYEYDGMDYMLNRVFWIQLIYTLFATAHAIVFNNTGRSLFLFPSDTLRNDNVRIGLGVFVGFYFVYAFYNWLQGNRRMLMTAAIAIGIFGLFYADMTRVAQMAVIGAMVCMWLFYREHSKSSVVKFMIAITMLVVFLNSELFTSILNVFSTDNNVNALSSSTLARYNAIEYFSQFTRKNPFLGMGWIRPYTDELTRIWSGPTNTAYLDDLGFLGQFYRQGILGIVIYVALLVRMGYVILKVKGKCNEQTLLIGIFAYIVFTTPSLNCFDGERMMVMPFYLASFEYIYTSVRKKDELNKIEV